MKNLIKMSLIVNFALLTNAFAGGAGISTPVTCTRIAILNCSSIDGDINAKYIEETCIGDHFNSQIMTLKVSKGTNSINLRKHIFETSPNKLVKEFGAVYDSQTKLVIRQTTGRHDSKFQLVNTIQNLSLDIPEITELPVCTGDQGTGNLPGQG